MDHQIPYLAWPSPGRKNQQLPVISAMTLMPSATKLSINKESYETENFIIPGFKEYCYCCQIGGMLTELSMS